MLRTLFFGAICFFWVSILNAQVNDYYWVDNERIELTASSTHFIVTADAASTLTSAKVANLKKYESWAHKPYAIAESKSSTTSRQLGTELGFGKNRVKVSPGYALSDGFIIYPTRTIVAQLINKGDNKGTIESIIKEFGIKSITEKFGTYRIELNDVRQSIKAANALKESGLFHFAQPDFYAPIERFQINDPLFSQQFQMHNTGQTLDGVTGANDADCNALEAWGISTGSSSITVAVIDDGMEDHEDFNNAAGQSRYTAGYSPANNGNGDAVSGGAHGVSCAGSITASHNNIGVRGVAPLANIISVNIFVGGESTQDIADGITWAKNQGADVMSNSWGYGSCTASFANINNAMSDANSNGRGGLGCVIVFASGNDYQNCVSYPGNNSVVIGVGAIANTGVRSAYSNYGPTLDIVAPSNNVGGPGAGVRTTDRMGSAGYGSSNYTATFGGTSSACPVVAGVATLLLGYNSGLTSDEVKNILYTTATDIGSSGFDNQYGHGRVNAFAALQAAGGGNGGGATCSDGVQNGQETGVDCGGPDCPSCPPTGCNGTTLDLSITLDNYPEETSWEIRNDAGAVVASSGGIYTGYSAGSTITESICLPDGCYTFTISDAYGDGLCCSYGNGSYSLSNGGTVLASGGQFTTNEATDFCIEPTCSDVDLSITLDNYPEETSWEIRSDAGALIASSGGIYTGYPAGSTITESVCLPDDCYTFTIFDGYGDGLCCSYGNGSYSLSDGGTVLASGGQFTSSEATDFCIGAGNRSSKTTHLDDVADVQLYPNPALNEVFVKVADEINQISVFNIQGKEVLSRSYEGIEQTTLDVSQLNAGTYLINIQTEGEILTERLVIQR